MAKAPIKAVNVNRGFIFTKNPDDSSKTDLNSKNKLYFSKHTPDDVLDEYLKTNFDTLYTQDARTYTIGYDVRRKDDYITCEIPNTWIATFDAPMPQKANNRFITRVQTIDDYDIGICYNRGVIQKEIEKVDGLNSIKNTFQIVLAPCTPEELQASLIAHYQSYLLLGITELIRDEYNMLGITELIRDDYNMQYTSNMIVKSEATG